MLRWGCSELELEGELDRARSANLVQRIEAAALATASEIVVEHHRSLPELRRAEVIDGASEVRVIQNVEEISSRLERESFGESELAAQCDVPLCGAESAQSIASQIALCRGRNGSSESRLVDDLAPGCARRGEIERHVGHDIRALHTRGARQYRSRI